MRRRIMQAKACAHQRAKSCEATLCSGNVPIYTKYFDMSYIKPYNRQG